MSLPLLFRSITRWQRAAFPNATAEGAARHLEREARELQAALTGPTGDVAEELADCFLLICGVANRCGMTAAELEDAILDKLAVNRSRAWKPCGEGEFEHVR